MKIVECKVNHLVNPLGYAIDRLRFSWLAEDTKAKKQKDARLQVREENGGCIYDSGFSDELDMTGTSVDLDLKPYTRYQWKVNVRADNGDEAESGWNWFETAKREESWQADWITCAKEDRLPVFHKTLRLMEDSAERDQSEIASIRKARLYICGLGAYSVRINGKMISKEYLAPYCSNYKSWIQYQTYDVTDLMKSVIGIDVSLGNSWYLSRFGWASKPGDQAYYGKNFCMIAELHVWFEDGAKKVFCTDDSWTVRRSNVTFSGIYDGEIRDDTLPQAAETQAAAMEMWTSDKKAASLSEDCRPLLTERYSLPVIPHEILKPVKLIHTPAQETVLDIGQNLTGIFRLHVCAEKGRKIHLQFGEVLQNGSFYRDNLRSALAEYTYVSDGREKWISPEFTFYGYRYVKVEGLPDLTADDFEAVAMYSDLERTGTITTGHAKLNRLIENAVWGLRDNFLDVPTDCPQRDERMGWTGDAQVFCDTACDLYDGYEFYRKYLHDLASEQELRDGAVPDVVPSFGYQNAGSVWGDAACIIPWKLYVQYGDPAILSDQYESMRSWVDYIRRTDGENHGWREVFHYGDWLALDHPNLKTDTTFGGTDVGYIADLYYAKSAEIVSKSAEIIGKQEDAETYGKLSDSIMENLRKDYFSQTGRCCIDTETALILALKFDLASDREFCRKQLQKRFAIVDNKLQTGFVGTPFLGDVLTEAGMGKLAYDLLLSEEYPGWLYEVNLGATTVWERWNSMNADGSVSSTGMNSFNHYAYGSIVGWMFRGIAGLRPADGSYGYKRVIIQPAADERIHFADMSYRSIAGTYRVNWRIDERNHIHLQVSVPFNCCAELKLPHMPKDLPENVPGNPVFSNAGDGTCILDPGDYSVSYRMEE